MTTKGGATTMLKAIPLNLQAERDRQLLLAHFVICSTVIWLAIYLCPFSSTTSTRVAYALLSTAAWFAGWNVWRRLPPVLGTCIWVGVVVAVWHAKYSGLLQYAIS